MPPKRARTSTSTKKATKKVRLFHGVRKTLIPRVIALQQHQFVQVVDRGTITSQSVANTESNYSFALNDLDQVTTFTALFDAYRIDKVMITFFPVMNVNQVAAGNNGLATPFYTAIDHDDTSSLGSVAAIRQYATCQENISYDRVKRSVFPKVAQSVFRTTVATFGFSEPDRSPWIDCAYPDVAHYGIRTIMGSTGTAGTAVYNVSCRYLLSFKNTR